MTRSVMTGATAALVAMFPAAFILALLWKSPIPLGGYASGLEGSLLTPLSVVFYGVLGGFVVVPGLGAVAGAFAFRMADGDISRSRTLSIAFGVLCAISASVFLNMLDRIIGPW